tara:strand:+ start:4031 stop:4951 length:921 start_codon:yes stop_codon:yes gene_type:complete
MDVINKFKNGLKKTSAFISKNIIFSLKSGSLDSETLNEIETVLISADIGLEVTQHLIAKIKNKKIKNDFDNSKLLNFLSEEITGILSKNEKKLIEDSEKSLKVFIFIGVNGSGKTTSIGKIIKKIHNNKKILVAACDTFRAAATNQLKEWSDQLKADFFQGSINQDPASVAYGACEKAKSENYDYLIIDTAGRLTNNTNLVNQLIKIKSVVSKSMLNFDIRTLLVLDGTNGSNMIRQVETFNKSLEVSGMIITKLDGTAKGGALISIAKKFEIPIHFVGLGEKEDDLVEFNADIFSRSILEIESYK